MTDMQKVDPEKYAAVAKVYARFFNQTLLEQLAQRDWHHCEAQVPAPAIE